MAGVIYLDPDEIAALTPGLTQPAAIVRELRRLGIRAELRRDGSVLVLQRGSHDGSIACA